MHISIPALVILGVALLAYVVIRQLRTQSARAKQPATPVSGGTTTGTDAPPDGTPQKQI